MIGIVMPILGLQEGPEIRNFRLRLLLHTKTCQMKRVKDILVRKGSAITSVDPKTTVLDALKIMADQNIGSVMVMDGNKVAGIMTERDYARKVILHGRSSTDTPVSEIMSTDFPRITPQDTIEQCMQLMSSNNIRYLPVYEEAKLSGIISINDVVRETIEVQKETISQLKDYLHSSL